MSAGACSRLVSGSLPTRLCGATECVDWTVIVPTGSTLQEAPPTLPLLLNLHGAGSSCEQLKFEHAAGLWDKRFSSGALPPTVVAMISGESSTYMDFYDESQLWESFLRDEFVPFVEQEFACGGSASRRMAMGTSMGGFGALLLCFRHPEDWGAVAACEPAIDAALTASDIPARSQRRQYEADHESMSALARQSLVGGKFGPGAEVAGFDDDFFRASNPVAMARDHGPAIRASGLKICVEVGDQDFLMLHDASELLHRILWEERIEHSYLLHHGADHLGPSMDWRMEVLCTWLGRMYRDFVGLSEDERAAEYAPATPDEIEFLRWAYEDGGKGPMRGTPADLSGRRAGILVRAGQSQAVRAQFGEQTDGPTELHGFRWRGRADGKL